ncbi:hypothetical protein VOLCADRAFT_107176 [Volvox carteri f. nagariensis]|uniref:C3H1-type domain-containing protein n=1 Tax=Volvox carteri f. nagariensis TaxID=3068 RepID=D8UCF1_VOLCA|nr:uncharacterized protein VOLCADRAFT_107176 [Volvox carteri f. nagariensis]EFJ42636.1 hypothetical protein VOLCADRAFT_107176 [Volvox carteri f. nagariensis]|eukprot:XP_002956287.1 hypothetical protein VOLCADRAFT_107176 [Volvox carteri f. nagariensis]
MENESAPARRVIERDGEEMNPPDRPETDMRAPQLLPPDQQAATQGPDSGNSRQAEPLGVPRGLGGGSPLRMPSVQLLGSPTARSPAARRQRLDTPGRAQATGARAAVDLLTAWEAATFQADRNPTPRDLFGLRTLNPLAAPPAGQPPATADEDLGAAGSQPSAADAAGRQVRRLVQINLCHQILHQHGLEGLLAAHAAGMLDLESTNLTSRLGSAPVGGRQLHEPSGPRFPTSLEERQVARPPSLPANEYPSSGAMERDGHPAPEAGFWRTAGVVAPPYPVEERQEYPALARQRESSDLHPAATGHLSWENMGIPFAPKRATQTVAHPAPAPGHWSQAAESDGLPQPGDAIVGGVLMSLGSRAPLTNIAAAVEQVIRGVGELLIRQLKTALSSPLGLSYAQWISERLTTKLHALLAPLTTYAATYDADIYTVSNMLATLLGGLELADCALSLLKPNHPQLGAAQRAWLLAAENEVTRDAICEADMMEAMWAKGYGPQLGCLWRLLERVDDTVRLLRSTLANAKFQSGWQESQAGGSRTQDNPRGGAMSGGQAAGMRSSIGNGPAGEEGRQGGGRRNDALAGRGRQGPAPWQAAFDAVRDELGRRNLPAELCPDNDTLFRTAKSLRPAICCNVALLGKQCPMGGPPGCKFVHDDLQRTVGRLVTELATKRQAGPNSSGNKRNLTAIGSSDCPERARKGMLGIDPSRIGSDEGSRGTEGEPETKTLTLELDGEDAGSWCDPEEDALLLFFKKVPVANNPQTEIALPAPPETDLPRAAEQLNRAWLGITAATLAETPDTQLMQEATFEQEVRSAARDPADFQPGLPRACSPLWRCYFELHNGTRSLTRNQRLLRVLGVTISLFGETLC